MPDRDVKAERAELIPALDLHPLLLAPTRTVKSKNWLRNGSLVPQTR